MKKGILVGNGFSSQLISNYKNEVMVNNFKIKAPNIYDDISKKYATLYKMKSKYLDRENFKTKVIEKLSISNDIKTIENIYNRIMINSGFYEELSYSYIYGIETIMKIAKLYNLNNINEIEDIATDICFNNGNNGINACTNINISKSRDLLNEFDYVFTTNYDYILDDLYDNEVLHIHGGFDYFKIIYNKNGATEVNKYNARNETFSNSKYSNTEIKYIKNPFLIWGSDDTDKQSKFGGGFHFPIEFPIFSPMSLVKEHIDLLKNKDNKELELHIFGYSGLNDSHINGAIKNNPSINSIIYYCNPDTELYNNDFYDNISNRLKPDNSKLYLKSWNDIWSQLR